MVPWRAAQGHEMPMDFGGTCGPLDKGHTDILLWVPKITILRSRQQRAVVWGAPAVADLRERGKARVWMEGWVTCKTNGPSHGL